MAGYVKKGPKSKPKKARKRVGTLSASMVKKGPAARVRGIILPI